MADSQDSELTNSDGIAALLAVIVLLATAAILIKVFLA